MQHMAVRITQCLELTLYQHMRTRFSHQQMVIKPRGVRTMRTNTETGNRQLAGVSMSPYFRYMKRNVTIIETFTSWVLPQHLLVAEDPHSYIL